MRIFNQTTGKGLEGVKPLLFSGPAHSARIVSQMLSRYFQIIETEPSPEKLLPEFERCSVFLDASMKVRITDEAIRRAPDLELIITATTGADHIQQSALMERNIPLLTLKGQTALLNELSGAAEHSWMLLMSCARKSKSAFRHVDDCGWNRVEFPGEMLRGKTLGIIGVGRIGRWMARYASAFDMRVVGYDPFIDDFPENVEKTDLDTLLQSSDFITIHVHLSPQTKGLLNQARINQVKRGCVMINTSRGEVWDERAVVQSLKEGVIASVGVDVLTDEPDIRNNTLWQYSQENLNVIITPHIAGFCPEAVDRVVKFSCRRIKTFFGIE